MKQKLLYGLSALAVALVGLLSLTAIGRTAITELSGLAVAQSGTLWKNVRDASAGDNMSDGILAAGMIFFDAAGNNFDRLRGSIANGILVDVTRAPGSNQTPADAFANPTTFQGTWSLGAIFNGTTWDRWRGQVSPVQGPNLFNSSNVSAANTQIVVSIAGVAGQRVHLYEVSRARCTPAGVSTLVVDNNGTQVYSANEITNQDTFSKQWATALTGPTNTTMNITLAACGAGNVGVLAIQADQF